MDQGSGVGHYDGDGDPDIYASNLKAPNCLYRTTATGISPSRQGIVGRQAVEQFCHVVWDYNMDGALDLMVWSYGHDDREALRRLSQTSYEGSRDCLYEGTARDHFRNVTTDQKLVHATSPMGCNFR